MGQFASFCNELEGEYSILSKISSITMTTQKSMRMM